ncbi:MAG: hypothetical protein KDC84_06925 [Crocinitomicaceae bacterium]|nr:hypothetical protein [Crocinitomicaceae bacterium]
MKKQAYLLILSCIIFSGISTAQEKEKNLTKKEPVKLKKVDPQKSQIKQVKVVAEPQKNSVKK